MTKRLLAFIFVISIVALGGCTPEFENNSLITDSSNYNIDINGYITDYLSCIDVPYEQGDNYEIFADSDSSPIYAFRYIVFDANGYTIDEGYHDSRGSFGFNTNDDGILELDYGFGGLFWQRRYYDVSKGRVSRFFSKPLDTHGELVAYFEAKGENGDWVLVIQNMFNPSEYYQEIERNFSLYVITMPSKAEFLDNGKKLSITYWITPNDEEVTEIIDLE